MEWIVFWEFEMSSTRLVLLVASLFLPGCAEDLDLYASPAGLVQAQFDPTSSPAAVPTPTDLARDPVTGLLQPPVPACAWLKQGPYTMVTAGDTATAAPEVKVAVGGAYQVTVSSATSSHLRFSVDAVGPIVVYLDVNTPLLAWNDKGKQLKLDRSDKGITGCSTLGARHLLTLPAKGAYWLELGPMAKVTKVNLALVPDTAELAFGRYLSTLDGYPVSSSPQMYFTGTVDLTTLTQTSVLGFDITAPSSPVRLTSLVLDAATVGGGGAAGAERTRLRITNGAGFSPKRRYAFFVVGGKGGVKAASKTAGAVGRPVIRSPLFQLTMAERPLCAWDKQRSWDPSSATCATPASGAAATGCCTHNYADQISSSVEAAMRAREDLKALTLIKRERAIKAAVLAAATTLEKIRQGNLSLLKVSSGAGVSADDVVLLWSFTTGSMNQILFDPTAAPPQLPWPTDLLKDSVTGLLKVPTPGSASAADKEWIVYLNTLDGWPVDTPATLAFSGDLDSTSVNSKAVLVASIPASGPPAVVTGTSVAYDATSRQLSVTRPGGWARGTSYVALALAGGIAGLKNKQTGVAGAPRRSPRMELVLSTSPLCTWDRGRALDSAGACTPASGSLATGCCTKLHISNIHDDPKALIGGKTALAKVTALEKIRRTYDPLLQNLVSAKIAARSEVVALWAFSTSSLAEISYDLTRAGAPWPNDLHLDSKTGKVALPAPAMETKAAKALRLGLNNQDGFSIQGRLLAGVTGKLDRSSVVQGTSLLIFNLNTGLAVTNKLGVALDVGTGTLALVPSRPLTEQTTYGVALVSKLTAGSLYSAGGLWDTAGKRVAAAPLSALVRARTELYKGGKSLVSHLDDTTAKRAEQARLAAKPLFALLDKLSLARLDVVAAWTFTTQSVTAPATRLRASTWSALGKLDKLSPTLNGSLSPASTIPGAGGAVPTSSMGSWVSAGSFTSLMVLDQSAGGTLLADTSLAKAVSVPFIMTLPKGPAPAAGFPVVLFQHGFFRSRHDLLPVANALAKAGLAAVALDVVYHGARTWCTADLHCDAGTCDKKTGACKGGKLKTDAAGLPHASGARFLSQLDNPVALRDNFYQNQVDAVALLRAMLLGAEKGISGAGGPVKLDAKKVRYLGHSLGALLGPLVLATDPLPGRAVLTAPGASLSDVLSTSTAFSSTWSALLKAHGVTAGTGAALRFKAALQGVLDLTDPGSFASYIRLAQLPDRTSTGGGMVAKKQLMVQLAGVDLTVPYALGNRLAGLTGLTSTEVYRTTYTKQGHSFLISPSPKGTAAATAAAQIQAATFLSTGQVCWPDIASGKCQ